MEKHWCVIGNYKGYEVAISFPMKSDAMDCMDLLHEVHDRYVSHIAVSHSIYRKIDVGEACGFSGYILSNLEPRAVSEAFYPAMRRIDPDVIEAVCLLQEKAADSMADWYRDDFMKAEESVEKYGGRLIDWQSMSLASWLEQTRKSARAAACARKLMGVE